MKNVLVLDDNSMFRFSVKALLSEYESFNVIEAENITEANELAKKDKIDLAIIDIELRHESGIDFAYSLKINNPKTEILFVTIFDIGLKLSNLISASPSGIVYKDVSPELFITVINLIIAGGKYFDQRLPMYNLYNNAVDNKRKRKKDHYFDKDKNIRLTERECEIAISITKGKTSAVIAKELKVSSRTIDTHKRNMFVKLGIHKNIQLVNYVNEKLLKEKPELNNM